MGKVYSKAFASIEAIEEKDYGPNGGFTAILSTPSEDRDGDELYRDEWKDFVFDRYPLDIDHGMTVADTIGSFEPYFDGQKMMMDAYFASTPRAQEVRTLVDEKHIRTVSVAFLVDKTKKSGEAWRELLNAGIVAIPSNRDAIILASKAAHALKDALTDTTEGEVPEEVKTAVLEALGVKAVDEVSDSGTNGAELTPETKAAKNATIYVDVIPRFDYDSFATNLKAAVTASGIGGDGALVQAIHDASSHLGAACPVIEVTDEGSGADDGANKDFDDETFTKALDEVLTPEDSPAEAAAASDEEPAPADDAADFKARKRARELELFQMRAKSRIQQ